LAKVSGLLRRYAAQHGKDLWTTDSEHSRGRGDLLPGTQSLWVLNVGQVEANVTCVLNNHTRALLGSKEACHEAGLPRSHATPWPLDWDIAADTPNLLPISVVTEMPADHHGGPCTGCPFAIKLKQRDEHLTCTNEPCHTRRCELWRQREVNRQCTTVEAWCRANNVPLDRIYTGDDIPYNWTLHGAYNAPKALVDNGHCNGEECACFRVVYAPDKAGWPNAQRPDPEGAPDFVLMCSSAQRLVHRRKALSVADGADGTTATGRYERLDRARKEVVRIRKRRFLAGFEVNPAALATNSHFLQLLHERIDGRRSTGDDDLAAVWLKLVKSLLNVNAFSQHDRLDKVTDVIIALGGEVDDADLDVIRQAEAENFIDEVAAFALAEALVSSWSAERVADATAEMGNLLDEAQRTQVIADLRVCLEKPAPEARSDERSDEARASLRQAIEALRGVSREAEAQAS
jgi:hypothetical protein